MPQLQSSTFLRGLIRSCFPVFIFVFSATTLSAQRISYIVSFPNLAHHEAKVELIISDVPSRNAQFRMSRSSPGRYATHEFGKNVYNVKAFDAQGKSLSVNRADGDIYEVSRHSGYIRIQYTLYGNYADGTYVGIDPSGIHLNMPGAFLWMKGVDNIPISIHFTLPEELHWNVATQLQPTNDPQTFTAPGLQYFMDCPVLIGDLRYRKWEVKNPDGKTYSFRIALDGHGEDSVFTNFSAKVQKIVQQAQAVFGETPRYDYGNYTFLASINPYVHGDGMEHRNSTMITLPVDFKGEDFLLGAFAHEFFHCWNVERIRPKTLEPFNFEKSNMSNELWFAEGFTQYYGDLLVLRSGIGKDTDYVTSKLAGLVNTRLNTPGARNYSPVEASRMAVFVDAGVAIDKTNYSNIFTSYYPYGGSIALALDLELRGHYQKNLDDLMQAAWKKFGKTEISYTLSGLQDLLAAVTGDKKFADEYFTRFINGHETTDYSALLAPAGFTLQKTTPGKAWIGSLRYTEKEGLVITSNTLRETPLYEAGLDIDDKVIAVDNQPVKWMADLTRILEGHRPGDKLTIRFIHRGIEKTTTLVAQENPSLSVISFEKAGLPVTPAILQFRKNWLGGKE
ncbi:M61 family metallopeptidase [Flavitalea flava]